jgi:phosphate transport system permease protein
MAWLVTQQLLPLDGWAWLVTTWLALGLIFTVVTTSISGRRVDVSDRLAAAIITSGALVVGGALLSTIGFVIFRGGSRCCTSTSSPTTCRVSVPGTRSTAAE